MSSPLSFFYPKVVSLIRWPHRGIPLRYSGRHPAAAVNGSVRTAADNAPTMFGCSMSAAVRPLSALLRPLDVGRLAFLDVERPTSKRSTSSGRHPSGQTLSAARCRPLFGRFHLLPPPLSIPPPPPPSLVGKARRNLIRF